MPITALVEPRLEGLNSHIFGEHDAIEFCSRNKIRVLADATKEFGCLAYYQGHVFLVINPFLDAGTKIWVMWHEIGHFLLHYPEVSNFSRTMRRKNDREANTLAAIAMMPRSAIEGKTIDQVVAEFEYPRPLVKIRFQIFRREGI